MNNFKCIIIIVLLSTNVAYADTSYDPKCRNIRKRYVVPKVQEAFAEIDNAIPRKDVELLIEYLSVLQKMKRRLQRHAMSSKIFKTVGAVAGIGASLATLVTDENWVAHSMANGGVAMVWGERQKTEEEMLEKTNDIIKLLITNTMDWASCYGILNNNVRNSLFARTRGSIQVVEVLIESVGRLAIGNSRDAEKRHLQNIYQYLETFKTNFDAQYITKEHKGFKHGSVAKIFTHILECTGVELLRVL